MKKQKMLRAVCCILATVMLLTCLAACGGGGKKGDEYVYVPEYTEVPEITDGMASVCVSGDNMYFTVNGLAFPDGTLLTKEECEEYYGMNGSPKYASSSDIEGTAETTGSVNPEKFQNVTYVTNLCTIKTDGSGFTILPDYTPPVTTEENSSASLSSMCADSKGNIWVLESYYTTIFNLPEGFDESSGDMYQYYDHDEQSYKIKKLSATGAEVKSIDASSLNDGSQDYYYINGIAADEAGNLILADSNNNISFFSADGSSLGSLKWEGYLNNLVKLGDGKVYASGGDDQGKSYLCVIDVAAKKFGEKQSLPNQAWNIFEGGSNFDLCYTDGSSLYGFKFGDETPTKILTWLNCDLNSDQILFSRILDNGNVFAISSNYDSAGSNACDFITLVKTPASEVTQKTPITLGCLYVDYNIRSKILNFNKTNDKYRIEVVDYSQYNTDEDYTAGVTKLNTEIIAGNAPDIISIDNFSYDQYAAKGLLEDLYPYIDNDKDLSRDYFIPSILKVQENDGKLYHIGTGFTLLSIVGSANVLGKEPGWTMSELENVVKQNPNADCPIGQNASREDLFNMFLMANYENYIDWETGKCTFDSDEFKSFLKFVSAFPSSETIDWQNVEWLGEAQLVSEGRQIMSHFSLYDFNAIQDYTATYGKDLVFKGYPCESREGTVASINGNIAITSTCENKEGAWEFVRDLFTDDSQRNMWNGMPISQKYFDEKLAEAMKQEYDENGKPISFGSMSDGFTTVEYFALTQEQADLIKNLINSVSRTALYDNTVIELITDSVTPFLKGEKTVDVVASEVQSRMTIYVNEQR